MSGKDDTVDIAELEKAHAELGEQIVKLGGKIKYPDNDDAKLKAKKSVERVKLGKAKADEEDPEDMLDGGADEAEEGDVPPKKKGKGMKKADEIIEKGADEELVFKGQTIKKSVVGAEQFLIIKGLTEDVAKAATDIAKAQDDALMARLEKRAEDEFAHVPGTTQERASMLKAVGVMSDDLKKAFEAVFAANEKLAKSAFDTVGVNKGNDADPDVKKARSDFDSKVTEIAKRDNIGRAVAMAKARSEHPDLFKAYQEAN